MDNARLLKAINFAAIKHKDQRRKDASKSPYINHPIDVANLLAYVGADADVIMAGVLHDTVEDTDTSFDELVKEFGPRVADMVQEVTDDKSLSKVERKQLQIDHAETISSGAKMIKLADKISNLRDLHDNPPASWSAEEVYGYAVWCYAVFLNLKGTNVILEEILLNIFKRFGLPDLHPDVLNQLVIYYYRLITKLDNL